MKAQQSDTGIIVMLADKGNKMVVIENLEYSEKLANLVGSQYKLKQDVTLKTERKLSKILNKKRDHFNNTEGKQLNQLCNKLL